MASKTPPPKLKVSSLRPAALRAMRAAILAKEATMYEFARGKKLLVEDVSGSYSLAEAQGSFTKDDPSLYDHGLLRRTLFKDKGFETAFKSARESDGVNLVSNRRTVDYWRSKPEARPGLVGRLVDQIARGEKVVLSAVVAELAKDGITVHHPHLWNWVQKAQGKPGRSAATEVPEPVPEVEEDLVFDY